MGPRVAINKTHIRYCNYVEKYGIARHRVKFIHRRTILLYMYYKVLGNYVYKYGNTDYMAHLKKRASYDAVVMLPFCDVNL